MRKLGRFLKKILFDVSKGIGYGVAIALLFFSVTTLLYICLYAVGRATEHFCHIIDYTKVKPGDLPGTYMGVGFFTLLAIAFVFILGGAAEGIYKSVRKRWKDA